MLLFPRSFRAKVRCCFNHINTSGVAPLQLTETRLSGARMQRLLSQAVWDTDGVRDDLRTFVLQQLGSSPLTVVIDESGFLKRGTHSAGVGKQHYGPTGDVRNCQVGVFLSLVTATGHTLIDRELYLPADWTSDPARYREAGIPEHVPCRTKPQLAQHMLERLLHAHVPIAWVVADSVYGSNP